MFGEGRPGPGPGGPGMRHRARSPLPGTGNVPGTGLAGCPGSHRGVSALSGTGHGRWGGLLPPRQGRAELLWPHVNSPPPLLWPQCLQTTGPTQHLCMGHSQCRMDPGGEHQDGAWGEHPRHAWTTIVSSVLGCQQHRNHTKTSRLPCQCWHRDIFWLSL